MKTLIPLLALLLLEGCAGSYACKGFPQFSACKSATQAYRATNHGAPPASLPEAALEGPDRSVPAQENRMSGVNLQGQRSPAQTLRIWQAPYEDEHGDLIGSSTVVTEIEPRRWRVGESQATVRRRQPSLKLATAQGQASSDEDRGGFPLFQSAKGLRRLEVEEVDYREP